MGLVHGQMGLCPVIARPIDEERVIPVFGVHKRVHLRGKVPGPVRIQVSARPVFTMLPARYILPAYAPGKDEHIIHIEVPYALRRVLIGP